MMSLNDDLRTLYSTFSDFEKKKQTAQEELENSRIKCFLLKDFLSVADRPYKSLNESSEKLKHLTTCLVYSGNSKYYSETSTSDGCQAQIKALLQLIGAHFLEATKILGDGHTIDYITTKNALWKLAEELFRHHSGKDIVSGVTSLVKSTTDKLEESNRRCLHSKDVDSSRSTSSQLGPTDLRNGVHPMNQSAMDRQIKAKQMEHTRHFLRSRKVAKKTVQLRNRVEVLKAEFLRRKSEAALVYLDEAGDRRVLRERLFAVGLEGQRACLEREERCLVFAVEEGKKVEEAVERMETRGRRLREQATQHKDLIAVLLKQNKLARQNVLDRKQELRDAMLTKLDSVNSAQNDLHRLHTITRTTSRSIAQLSLDHLQKTRDHLPLRSLPQNAMWTKHVSCQLIEGSGMRTHVKTPADFFLRLSAMKGSVDFSHLDLGDVEEMLDNVKEEGITLKSLTSVDTRVQDKTRQKVDPYQETVQSQLALSQDLVTALKEVIREGKEMPALKIKVDEL